MSYLLLRRFIEEDCSKVLNLIIVLYCMLNPEPKPMLHSRSHFIAENPNLICNLDPRLSGGNGATVARIRAYDHPSVRRASSRHLRWSDAHMLEACICLYSHVKSVSHLLERPERPCLLFIHLLRFLGRLHPLFKSSLIRRSRRIPSICRDPAVGACS